jgi:hypothetical protein
VSTIIGIEAHKVIKSRNIRWTLVQQAYKRRNNHIIKICVGKPKELIPHETWEDNAKSTPYRNIETMWDEFTGHGREPATSVF